MLASLAPMKLPVLLLALATSTVAVTASAEIAVVDSGTFRISLRDKTLGTERFAYQTSGDSLVLTSWTRELVPGVDGADTLEKTMMLVTKADDYDVRNYQSSQSFLGQTLHRGIVMQDTAYTSYKQINDAGTGDVMVRPPGRVYILDPQVFSLYDFICRNLHGREFTRRDLAMLALGARDTFYVAKATDLGRETIRWASRPVAARKIHIAEGTTEYFMWISDRGHLLRLSQPAFGMVVERMGPRVRPAKSRSSG